MTFPPVDATRVPCPVCEAPAGEQCRYLATVARVYNITGGVREARTITHPRAPHGQRKMLAAVALARAPRPRAVPSSGVRGTDPATCIHCQQAGGERLHCWHGSRT